MEVTNIDNNKILVTTEVQVEHSYRALLEKRQILLDEKQKYSDVMDARIAEVDFMIAEADRLGVMADAVTEIDK